MFSLWPHTREENCVLVLKEDSFCIEKAIRAYELVLEMFDMN